MSRQRRDLMPEESLSYVSAPLNQNQDYIFYLYFSIIPCYIDMRGETQERKSWHRFLIGPAMEEPYSCIVALTVTTDRLGVSFATSN